MPSISDFKRASLSFIRILLPYSLCISLSLSADDSNIKLDYRKSKLSREHLPTFKEENFERVLGLIKSVEAQKEKNQDIRLGNYFVKISKSIQKSKEKNYVDLAKMIIYSYPLFTNEETLFKFLITQKKEFSSFIPIFLRQLALEAFPNGFANFQAAANSFISLKDEMVDDPLFTCLLKNAIDYRPLEKSTQPKFLPTASNIEWFERWSIDYFVDVLTQRDINIYCAISFGDLRANLEHPSTPPSSILAVTCQFDRTVNWLCLEILKRNDARERTKMIQLVRIIGRVLFHHKNYHGAMQVALAFSKIQVSRILSPKESEEINGESFVKDLTPDNNYRNYRALLNYPNSNSPELSILPVFFKDLLFAHEMKAFDEIALMMEKFYRTQTFLHPTNLLNGDDLEGLSFVSQLPTTHDSTLDEMSSLIKDWHFPRADYLPQNLEDWTMSHFYSFLEKHDRKSNVGTLMSKNIYSGKDLVDYLKGCSSSQEIDKNMTQIGFTPSLRKILFNQVKTTPSSFVDLPTLRTSKSRSRNLNLEKKSIV